MTVTPDWLYGADTQSTGTNQFGGAGTGLWDTTSTTSAFSFIAGRVSGFALHVVESGAAQCYLSRIPVASQHQVGAFWFRVPAAPVTNNSALFFWIDAAAVVMGRFDIAATSGVIRAAAGTGTRQNGPAVADNAWHLLTWHLDTSGTTWTMHWTVDDVAQTNATQGGKVATDVFKFRIGTVGSTDNLTYDIDDIVYGSVAGEYPYFTTASNHQVIASIPNGDGAHSLGGAITTDSGATTNLYQALDDTWPPTTTDYVRQTVIGASNYAEIAFTDAPGSPTITAVQGTLAGFSQAGTAPNDGTTTFYDSSSNSLTQLYSGDMTFSSVQFRTGMITAPAAGWTTGFDGVKARVGFSLDVTPNPRWTALMLEYLTAVTVVTATAAVTVTAAPAVSSVLRKRFAVTAPTVTATVSANLTITSSVITGSKWDTTDEEWDSATDQWDGTLVAAAQVAGTATVSATLTRTTSTISATANVTTTAAVSGTPVMRWPAVVDVPVSAAIDADVSGTSPGSAAVAVSAAVSATAKHTAFIEAHIVVGARVSASPSARSDITRFPALWRPLVRLEALWRPLIRLEASTLGTKSPIRLSDDWFVGEDQDYEWLVKSSATAIKNITGFTIQFRMALAQGQASILTKSATVTDGAEGLCEVDFDAADTSSLAARKYFYTLSRTDSTHNQVLAYGDAHLQARVS